MVSKCPLLYGRVVVQSRIKQGNKEYIGCVAFVIFKYGVFYTALCHPQLASQFTYQLPTGEIDMHINRRIEYTDNPFLRHSIYRDELKNFSSLSQIVYWFRYLR